MKKTMQATTRAIVEKIKEKQGKSPRIQVLTTASLRQLDKMPDVDTLEYLGLRYRG